MDPREYILAKYCSKCGVLKPLSEYYLRSGSDQHRAQCKTCSRTEQKYYNYENREHYRDYYRNRYRTDDTFRITRLLRTRLHHALESQGATKYGNTMSLEGCSPEWLVAWLNYTESVYCNEDENTHIDHFFPFTAYDLSNPFEQQKVMYWRNLRVIPASMNMIKSNTMPSHEEINDHLALINSFLKNNGYYRMSY